MDREEHGIEVDLLQFAKKLLENAKYIILVIVIFGILGYLGTTIFMTPVYQAGAKMIVNSRKDETLNITNDQLNSARNLVETYAVIIRGRDVMNRVIDELDLQESYDQLANSINVKSVNNTPIMQIYVKHSNRDTALMITAKLLEIAPAVLVETTSAGSVKAVEQPYISPDPVSPNVFRNTVLMSFCGFVLTCLVILILMLLDNTYKTDVDIQKDLGLPVLGIIPEVESCKARSIYKRKQKREVHRDV